MQKAIFDPSNTEKIYCLGAQDNSVFGFYYALLPKEAPSSLKITFQKLAFPLVSRPNVGNLKGIKNNSVTKATVAV
jgi:hypothetical protein